MIAPPSCRPLRHCYCGPLRSCRRSRVSNRDTCRPPLPPPLLITIALPSCRPLRCRRHCPLLHHRTSLRHLLTHHHPSTHWLAVASDWLSSLHLSSRHCLNVPSGCHVASRCATLLFAPAGCRVTLPPPCHPLIYPGWLLRHPLLRHRLSMRWLVIRCLSLCHPHI